MASSDGRLGGGRPGDKSQTLPWREPGPSKPLVLDTASGVRIAVALEGILDRLDRICRKIERIEETP